jgi:hypothetical protein
MPLPGILINKLRYILNVFSLIAIHRLRAEFVRSERIKLRDSTHSGRVQRASSPKGCDRSPPITSPIVRAA